MILYGIFSLRDCGMGGWGTQCFAKSFRGMGYRGVGGRGFGIWGSEVQGSACWLVPWWGTAI